MKKIRSEEAIKKWLPLASFVSAISFVVTFLLGLPIERVIVATIMGGILVFSGFFFRSFGRDEDDYKE
ncbi:MAG: hypothetical protein ACPKPY_12275 [Nitrososphaeraceae archaeon]